MIHKGRLKFLFQTASFLFPEFKAKQRSRRRSVLRIRLAFAEQVFRSWENVGYELSDLQLFNVWSKNVDPIGL